MLQFTQSNLLSALEECDEHLLDKLEFGVVAMNPSGTVERYNAAESKIAGLSAGRVIGKNFFAEVAPCTRTEDFEGRFRDNIPEKLENFLGDEPEAGPCEAPERSR